MMRADQYQRREAASWRARHALRQAGYPALGVLVSREMLAYRDYASWARETVYEDAINEVLVDG